MEKELIIIMLNNLLFSITEYDDIYSIMDKINELIDEIKIDN